MAIENIQLQIKILQQRLDGWPDETIKLMDDKSEILALTDAHFNAIETDLQKLIEQCKMLPTNDQNTVTSSLKELKDFVQHKFIQAEKELIVLKGQMNQGRHHFKAIKAYTRA